MQGEVFSIFVFDNRICNSYIYDFSLQLRTEIMVIILEKKVTPRDFLFFSFWIENFQTVKVEKILHVLFLLSCRNIIKILISS